MHYHISMMMIYQARSIPKLFRSALSRAILCCSDVYQFQQEERYIELSFRLNQFPADLLENIFVYSFVNLISV